MLKIPPAVANQARKFFWQCVGKYLLPNREQEARYKELEKKFHELEARHSEAQVFERLKAEMVPSKEFEGAYSKRDGSGLFCGVCLLASHKESPLVPQSNRDLYSCLEHEGTFRRRTQTGQGLNDSPRPLNLRRSWTSVQHELERRSRRRSRY
jgi:hypothetical protein